MCVSSVERVLTTESERKVQEEGPVTGSPMTEYLKVLEFKAFQFK